MFSPYNFTPARKHTLVSCWMPKRLPARNECTGCFAPTLQLQRRAVNWVICATTFMLQRPCNLQECSKMQRVFYPNIINTSFVLDSMRKLCVFTLQLYTHKHTLVSCWMPKCLHARNECTGCFNQPFNFNAGQLVE